jgi:hypothetical protein
MRAVIPLLFSVLSAAIVTAAPAVAQNPEQFSWQNSYARVTPEGDLEWAPRPFVFQAGTSVRYIDYEHGNDNNPGTRAEPWEHHPWDAEARGKAAKCAGIHTYIFRRGVVYRGALVAKESGQPDTPIRLTSDPSWGSGEANLYGSRRITGEWKRANARSAPGIPSPESVWYKDIGMDVTPRAVWMETGGVITRIPLARRPNWKVSNPDDVKSEWYEWDKTELIKPASRGKEAPRVWATDATHLTAVDKNAYAEATVWTEYAHVMGTPYATLIEEYDPVRHAIRLACPSNYWGTSFRPIEHCRYFLENLPQFLDAPGQYYFVEKGPLAGRLYLRLPGEQNPNRVAVEIAERLTMIDIREQSDIQISGLTFRFQNVRSWYWRDEDTVPEAAPACVKALGACRNIRIANCKFEHIVRAFLMASGGRGIADEIAFTDNDIQYTDYGPILVQNRGRTPPAGNLYTLKILRNRLRDVGLRPFTYDHGHAMQVIYALLPEIAGNMIDRCWGAGIYVWGGKGGAGQDWGGDADGAITRPLSRVLIHHNKVTNSLLNTNDWGGIEFWQSGPAYVYDNISGNPGGYRHWSDVEGGKTVQGRNHATARFGFAYYLDGGFKTYVFNNVAWGKSSDLASPLCATGAFHEVVGFMNAIFNNTACRFGAPFRRQASFGGHSAYLGNLVMDSSEVVFRHADITAPEDTNLLRSGVKHYPVETMAYANNVFVGQPRVFGYFDLNKSYATLKEFSAGLAANGSLASQTGWKAEESPVLNAEEHNFRPRAGSAVAGRGVKYFVPWSLSAVVGEWQFYKLPADPTRILGENWYATEEHKAREMYYRVPRNELRAHNVTASDYVQGTLEDWTEGALSLNGRDQYCSIADAELRSAGAYHRSRNLDMDTNNFLIEAVFRTEPAHTNGWLVSKFDTAGYALNIDDAGRIRMRLRAGGGDQSEYSRTSAIPVNDGKWHHVIAEVDRRAAAGLRIYIDGKPAAGPLSGRMPEPDATFSNTADFLVGKGPAGNFFAGTIDYLRVSRGTLADARTTIDELYKWEFDGPFLRDFRGKAPTGERRDAGAFQSAE